MTAGRDEFSSLDLTAGARALADARGLQFAAAEASHSRGLEHLDVRAD
jgi:hypothetical protein